MFRLVTLHIGTSRLLWLEESLSQAAGDQLIISLVLPRRHLEVCLQLINRGAVTSSQKENKGKKSFKPPPKAHEKMAEVPQNDVID